MIAFACWLFEGYTISLYKIGEYMEELFEALYNERRNAIPSWQGYHFQGMAALLRFLEELNIRYATDKSGMRANELKLRIEWLEDFILFEKDEVKEIYQIKKTLKKENRNEVLKNFIIQFKLLGKSDVKWVLGYDNTDLTDLELTQTEFEQLYKEYIEDEWLKQIKLLQDNYADNNYWKENLDKTNSASTCKAVRAYVRKLIEAKKEKYIKKSERENIYNKYLEPLRLRLQKCTDDFANFKKCVGFQQIGIREINDKCKTEIKSLFSYVPERNQLMTEQDILDKLYTDIYEKLMGKENRENCLEYAMADVQKVFLNKENSDFRWKAELYREKGRLCDEMLEDICKDCKGDKCPNCLLKAIKECDMGKVIDNMNLEYALFSAGNANESQSNKISDIKRNVLLDILEKFKMEAEIKDNEILEIGCQYFVSTLIGGSERMDKNVLKGVLDNYWEHSMIYRDYERVLTKNYSYRLDEGNISFLKNTEDMAPAPLFDEIRNTEFIHYEDVVL